LIDDSQQSMNRETWAALQTSTSACCIADEWMLPIMPPFGPASLVRSRPIAILMMTRARATRQFEWCVWPPRHRVRMLAIDLCAMENLPSLDNMRTLGGERDEVYLGHVHDRRGPDCQDAGCLWREGLHRGPSCSCPRRRDMA